MQNYNNNNNNNNNNFFMTADRNNLPLMNFVQRKSIQPV